MKRKILKWTLRLTATVLTLFGLLILIVLNPNWLFANKTVFNNFTVYHSKPLDKEFKTELEEATKLLKVSEIYDPNYKIDICLNDGSKYPTLIQSFQDQAFGIGFYNKVVIMGNININQNYTEINDYKYNLTQLIAHETIHCFQFNNLGLWKSNPIAKYPAWKWDGYNEFVARQHKDQTDLKYNINRLDSCELKNKDEWGISFADSTYTSKEYYKWWILMQYCKDIKKMSYLQILADTTKEETLRTEMMIWAKQN